MKKRVDIPGTLNDPVLNVAFLLIIPVTASGDRFVLALKKKREVWFILDDTIVHQQKTFGMHVLRLGHIRWCRFQILHFHHYQRIHPSLLHCFCHFLLLLVLTSVLLSVTMTAAAAMAITIVVI